MSYQNLHFFDKLGNPGNFSYDSDKDLWTGKVHLPRVSRGLYEVAHVYILEKFLTSANEEVFGFPHADETDITTAADTQWTVKWKEDQPDELFLFQFDGTEDAPSIQSYSEIDIELGVDPTEYVDTSTGLKVSDLVVDNVLQLNIAFNSEVESVYERTLQVVNSLSGSIILELIIYAESVDEDHRLKTMVDNFGYKVNHKDSIVFRDSDINELSPDYQILNTKRKEAMLEGHNIFPFVGSYKGLINAIKFFGYDNITMQEYWQNVDVDSPQFGKYIHTKVLDIFDSELDPNDTRVTLPNKTFRKTSKFALHFRINEVQDGLFDQYDLPITQESFAYTIEEALVKLYALKRKLKKDFLPSNSRIVDIMGIGDYFGRVGLRSVLRKNRTESIDAGITPSFTIAPNQIGCIQDLRNLDDLLFAQYTPYLIPHDLNLGGPNTGLLGPYGPLGDGSSGHDYTVSELTNVLLAYFTRYHPNLDTIEELPDIEGIPVGYPVVLTNDSFSLAWNDAQVQWNSLNTGGTNIYDFEADNPGTGDIFSITDNISGESISYTASFGDTDQDVANALRTAWLGRSAAQDRPWLYFYVTVESTITGYVLRAKGIGTQASTTQIDFQPSVVNGLSTNDQTFVREVITQGTLYTWDSIHRNNFTEIEWTVWKDADDTPAWNYNVRGALADYDNHALIIPYVGSYNVEMRLYDTFNQISNHIEYNYITAEAKEVEFAGFYKFREAKYYWDLDIDITWNEYASYWDLPIRPDATVTFANASWYESLDRINAILNNFTEDDPNFHLMNFQNNGDISWSGPYHWSNLDSLHWSDVYHLWWDSTNVTGDTPAHFDIVQIIPGEYLYIETSEHRFDPTITTFQEAADELNASVDPIVSKYIYNVLYDANLNQEYIHCVAKYFGEYGDFVIGVRGDTGLVTVDNVENSRNSNPTWNDSHFLENGRILPRGVFLTFVYDKCRIPGKTLPEWIIKNTTDPDWEDIYFNGKYLGYLFQDVGNYTIELSLEDTNGNRNSVAKNILVVQ